MTVGDLMKVLTALPETFAVTLDTGGEMKHVRSVSLEPHNLVLRDHMLSVSKIVDTVTAFDGVEYVVTVKETKYPTIIPMPNPVHSQLRRSVARLNGDDAA